MIRVRLNDGINLDVNADLAEFAARYQEAVRNGHALEIDNKEGKRRYFNPLQILYFEALDGEQETEKR